MTKTGDNGNTQVQFATFYLEDLLFGIDVMQVQEIIRYQEMTPAPLSAPEIEGLINLRGQIITAVNLRKRLSMGDWEDGKLPMNVVVRTEDGTVSLLVDEIGDVLEVENSCFEEPPTTVPDTCRGFINGVYKLEDKLLLTLDTEKVVDVHSV